MSRYQIINKIAARTGRAHETVRYILSDYEEAHPDKHIFSRPGGVIEPGQVGELYKLFKQGCGVKDLMKRFGRSKSSIYRIINIRRAKSLLASRIEFIASDEFLRQDASEKILAKSMGSAWSEEAQGAALRQAQDSAGFNREREVELFRRYNYLKYLAGQIRSEIKPARVLSEQLSQIENYLAEAEIIKKAIIEANLGLVVSIASKHSGRGANLSDLVSEGNLSLMRAVEKFDYTRGFRFGTYAAWAIAKDYARKIPAEAGRLDRATAASLVNVQRDLRATEAAGVVAVERARRSLVQVIRDNLNEREQYIILNHFGLVGSLVRKDKKTLKQIGEELDLSKERVRQIELIALQKLRQFLSIEEFELLMG